ncbi:MAG: preprotein translocase subunit SecG [Planctomycetaceae bacterium]|nr:preprotein translocase subunit SecG [Planctomycetaceae bacterium]
MSILALHYFFRGIFGALMCLTSLFLILLVMLQRGRGGGLSGAFGGAGGQSAFGTKTGDVFTRFTIITATIWISLCILLIYALSGSSGPEFETAPAATSNSAPATEPNSSGSMQPDLTTGIETSQPEATQPAPNESQTPAAPPANGPTPENKETP